MSSACFICGFCTVAVDPRWLTTNFFYNFSFQAFLIEIVWRWIARILWCIQFVLFDNLKQVLTLWPLFKVKILTKWHSLKKNFKKYNRLKLITRVKQVYNSRFRAVTMLASPVPRMCTKVYLWLLVLGIRLSAS